MTAEPNLLEYAYRVKQDIPFEADVINFEKINADVDEVKKPRPIVEIELNGFDVVSESSSSDEFNDSSEEHYLTSSYDRAVNVFWRFQQESIALGLSELRSLDM